MKINQSNINMTKKEYKRKNYQKKTHKHSSNNFKDIYKLIIQIIGYGFTIFLISSLYLLSKREKKKI